MNILTGVEDFKALKGEKVVLMDVEGTLTPDSPGVPEDPRPEHVYQLFEEDESFEVETDLGYWSGLNLLAGEKPSDYFERVKAWWSDEITHEEFEEENVERLNSLLDRTDHSTAQELLEWYNKSFLNLRPRSEELVHFFQDKGFKTGIVSHTSKSLSVTAAERLEADFVVPSWTFKFKDGRFRFIEKRPYSHDKALVVDEMNEAGVKEVWFVGNGENDVSAAEAADEGFMVENVDKIDYCGIDAFSGSFEEVLEKAKQVLNGERP
ncbi:MAG: HAD family hydrolase [Candidatus Nanohalobium sp.]